MAHGEVAVPQYANSIQRMVEVFVESIAGEITDIQIRPTYARFDQDGKADLRYAAEVMAVIIGALESTKIGGNVFDVTGKLRAARRGRETRWRVDPHLNKVFNAVSGTCGAIVSTEHPDWSWAKNNPPRREVQVVASAPGSGKTTYAKAFAVALAHVNADSRYPIGSVFLVHHITTADAVYRELNALLPNDTVAVFSTKHDASRDDVVEGFHADELDKYPVLVVTHEFYMGIRGAKSPPC